MQSGGVMKGTTWLGIDVWLVPDMICLLLVKVATSMCFVMFLWLGDHTSQGLSGLPHSTQLALDYESANMAYSCMYW